MKNKLYRLHSRYDEYWECHIPKKRGAGTYYLRGANNRFRKMLRINPNIPF